MDISGVVSSIANMGFPAVLCIIMIWLNHEQAQAHKEELQNLKTAIDNNTQAITELRIMMYSDNQKGA